MALEWLVRGGGGVVGRNVSFPTFMISKLGHKTIFSPYAFQNNRGLESDERRKEDPWA